MKHPAEIVCLAATMLSGCGGVQPPIGAPGAMQVHRNVPTASYQVLHVFRGHRDGSNPVADLLNVKSVLYGTTYRGGSANKDGTVFSITPTGTEKVLYRFAGGSDGERPGARLINLNGTLYGTTYSGGGSACSGGSAVGCGTIYSITPTGTEKVLYRFAGGSDGQWPEANLTNVNGTLYGTTESGGGSGCGGIGCGTVYAINASGTERVVYTFRGVPDGADPIAGLIDVSGTLYGTTYIGGDSRCGFSGGCGTVFRVATSGSEKVLHRFAGGSEASMPTGGLINVKGILYGTTFGGGKGGSGCLDHCGTIFSVTTTGKEKVVYSFAGGSDGASPRADLIAVKGTLYGTTYYGGNSGCSVGGVGCGTVYSIAPSGAETVLHTFAGGSDGAHPVSGLINVNGTLYGTTYGGGRSCHLRKDGCGTVFALTP